MTDRDATDNELDWEQEVVQRLIAKGLVGFKAPEVVTQNETTAKLRLLRKGITGVQKAKADRAYNAHRKRRIKGYKPWAPGGPGRPPKDAGFCRWCGGSAMRHSMACPRPEGVV